MGKDALSTEGQMHTLNEERVLLMPRTDLGDIADLIQQAAARNMLRQPQTKDEWLAKLEINDALTTALIFVHEQRGDGQ